MKKLLLVAAACVALASCVKNEVIPEPADKRPISYQALVKPETTRVEAYNNADFSATAFMVEEGETWPTTTGLYFNNVTVRDDVAGYVGQWTTDPACYWPVAGTLTFYAHSPATVVADALVAPWTYTFTDYSMDNNVDFMVAEIASGLSANNVPVVFGHKLTKVAVQIIVEEIIGTAQYFLKSITLNNLGNSATFTKTSAGVEDWTEPTKFTKTYNIFSGSMEVTADLSDSDDPQKVTLTKEFYLPHTFDADAEMVVSYDVTEAGLGTKTITKNIGFDEFVPAHTGWLKNNFVTYTLTIGAKERIIWDTPTVSDWTTVGYSVVI